MANLKYSVEAKLYLELKNKIKAPKFQRNFVWKKKARRELIDSIKRGLPIGSFLLQTIDNDNYNVIDGRQRFSTLLDYENHRYDYIEDSDISEEKILNILNFVPNIKIAYKQFNTSAQKKILDTIKVVALKQLKTKNAEKADVTVEIVSVIEDKFPHLGKEDKKLLNKAVDKFYDSIWQILDTTNIVLPCIIFNKNATDDEIVSTFINLNDKGTKLSKYDLYSASWQNDIIIVDDEEIIEKVISKYKDSLETNQKIETEDFNENEIQEQKQINVFEYAYALSKLIGEKCGNKIYQIKEASEVDSLGFSILASILNISSKTMVDLAKSLVNSKINYVLLKNKIIECVLEIQKHLEWYCFSPDGKNYFDHSLNQLVSYIVTVFKAKYEITSDGRIVDNSKKSKLKDFYNNLPVWYLYDNIRGYWSGSGDSKLDSLVLVDDIFQSRYFSKVAEEALRTALYDWIVDKNNEKNNSIKSDTKLFINYIIKKRCSEPHDNMDVEHIIPQMRLEQLSTRERGVLGVSSPANLTIIPRFDNRLKREKTYYELIDSKDETALIYDPTYLDKYVYPSHEEIKFIEAQSTFTVKNFDLYKKDRMNMLINLFVDLYYNKRN